MPKKVVKEAEPAQEELQAISVNTKDPRTLLILLDSNEAPIQAKAAEALHKYMQLSEQNCVELEELGVIAKVSHLLRSEEAAIRSFAVMCVDKLSCHAAIRMNLRKSDYLSSLLPLLEPDQTPLCHEKATAVLAHMAEEYSGKVHLYEGSVLEPLLKLLGTVEDVDVQSNTLKAISLLVQHYECQSQLCELEGVNVVLSLLGSEYAVIQKLTLETLECLMKNKECRSSLQEADGLTKVTEFIANKDYKDLHVEALAVLAHCLRDNDNMMALQSSGCLEKLLSIVAVAGVQEELKSNAVLAIAHAAEDRTNCNILHEQDVEKVVLGLLESAADKPPLCCASCLAITTMGSQLATSKQLIGKEGGIGSLVKLLSNEDVQCRSHAVQALAAVLSNMPSNCKILADHEGVEPLVALLEDSHSECRLYAAQCITEMGTHEFLRVQLIGCGATGVVEKLCSSLTFSEPRVQLACMEALAILSTDHEARQQFNDAGGITAVVNHLQSSREEMRVVACRLLAGLATNPSVAEAAIEHNAMNLLDDLTKHPGMTLLAQQAINHVLDSNLSAKYWQCGQLKHGDIIKDGFFDGGQARPGEKHPTLKQLIQKPLLLNRPVLYISLQPCKADTASEDMPSEASATSVSSKETRSRSRGSKEVKGKKGRQQQQQASDKENKEDNSESDTLTLPADPTLLAHINQVKLHIQTLPSTKDQAISLASYVSDAMGGAISEPTTFQYELVNGQAQYKEGSNLIPLGAVNKGLFRHRALLYKVLCDSIGLTCSLQRSQYGRVWNTIIVASDGQSETFVVDLIYRPGRLMPVISPEAVQYQTV